ncbi:MAG: transposase [Chitinispirillaceae bacterium]
MSTQPRVVVPHKYYQLRSEAAPGLKLFPSDKQENFFRFQLNRLLEEASYTLVDISLQQNHYHLVVMVSEIPVSWFMRTLNSVYAKYLNVHYNRHGTVFPVRFSSAILDESHGLEEVSCHVHLNPLRCKKKVSEILNEYSRSGCSFSGFGPVEDLFDVLSRPERTRHHMEFLNLNGGSVRYREIIRKLRRANEFGQNYPHPRFGIVGRPAFEIDCLAAHQARRERVMENRKRDPFEVIGILCRGLGMRINFKFEELFRRGRRNDRSRARELLAVLGVFRLEFCGADLARYLGITRSAVSRMIRRKIGGAGRPFNIRRIMEEYA